jgi:hypothetical protein
MRVQIKEKLKELDEELIHHVEFLQKGAFVVCKRQHKTTPFLIRGFCIKKGLYHKFFACRDEQSAKLLFNKILS